MNKKLRERILQRVKDTYIPHNGDGDMEVYEDAKISVNDDGDYWVEAYVYVRQEDLKQ